MVLIANRGDIAVGVIRTCESLGPETVVAVSEAGKDSMAATLADRAVCISPPRPLNSYLNVGAIVTAALGRKSDAIHSVYGFLLKQPRLAQAWAFHRGCQASAQAPWGPPWMTKATG